MFQQGRERLATSFAQQQLITHGSFQRNIFFCFLLQILYLTEPETWSAAAMYQATRIFASNLNAKMAQRYLSDPFENDCKFPVV